METNDPIEVVDLVFTEEIEERPLRVAVDALADPHVHLR